MQGNVNDSIGPIILIHYIVDKLNLIQQSGEGIDSNKGIEAINFLQKLYSTSFSKLDYDEKIFKRIINETLKARDH